MKNVTLRPAAYFTAGPRRYSTGARTLHWVTAILVFAVIPLGWIFAEFKTPVLGAPLWASLHKTTGLAIFMLVLIRIGWRFADAPPALPVRMEPWQKVFAIIGHWMLYLIFLVMPVSGYLVSSAGTKPISIVGLFDMPKLPVSHDMGEIAQQVHVFGQFAVYLLLFLHLAAVAWHLFVVRDAILDRMLPRQINAD